MSCKDERLENVAAGVNDRVETVLVLMCKTKHHAILILHYTLGTALVRINLRFIRCRIVASVCSLTRKEKEKQTKTSKTTLIYIYI